MRRSTKLITYESEVLNYLKHYYKIGVFDKFFYEYKKHIRPFFISYNAKNINQRVLLKFCDYVDHLDIKNKSKNRIYIYAKVFLKNIFRLMNLSIDLTLLHVSKNAFDIPKEFNYYTQEQFNKFISVETDPLWLLFFKLLFYMGLRKSEAQALLRDDLDVKTKTLKIYKQAYTRQKGNSFMLISCKSLSSNRTLPVPDVILQAYKNVNYSKKDIFMFPARIKKKTNIVISNNAIKERNKRDALLSGMNHIRIHDFRHSCAINLFKNNADIRIISKWLGHANVSITLKVYIHCINNELVQITDLINKSNERI